MWDYSSFGCPLRESSLIAEPVASEIVFGNSFRIKNSFKLKRGRSRNLSSFSFDNPSWNGKYRETVA